MRQCLSCRKQLDDAQYVCPSCGGRTHDPSETVIGQDIAPTTSTSGRRWAVKAPAAPVPAPEPVVDAAEAEPADSIHSDPAVASDTTKMPLPLSVTGKKWRNKTEDGRPSGQDPGSGPRPARDDRPSGQAPGSGPRPTYDGGQPGSGPRPARDLQVEAGDKPAATSSGVFDDFQRSPVAAPAPADKDQGSGLFDDLYQGPPKGPEKSAALTSRAEPNASAPRAAAGAGAAAAEASDAEEFPAAPVKSRRAQSATSGGGNGARLAGIVVFAVLVLGVALWFVFGRGATPAPAPTDIAAVGLPGLPAWAMNPAGVANQQAADIVVRPSSAQPQFAGNPLDLTPGPGDTLPRFTDAELGASYCPGAGWTVSADRFGNHIASPQQRPLPRAQLNADRRADGEDLAAYVQTWISALGKDVAGFAPIGSAPFSTADNGSSGMRVVFTDSEDGPKLRYSVFLLPAGAQRVLRLVCCADAADGAGHDADFLAMARSIRSDGGAHAEAHDAP